MSRHALIKAALEGLSLARAPLWLPKTDDCAGFVVTLHHVLPDAPAAFAPNALLSITPDFLDAFIAHFTSLGWRFVSVDEIVARTEAKPDPKRIAITLDDGFRDNAEHAWPIFHRHRTPFTIYVCVGFTERTSEIWYEALERIIAANDVLAVEGQGPAESLPTRSTAEKRHAFAAWWGWLMREADETRQRVAIRAMAEKYGLDLAELARALVMNWDELRAISGESLCTIGAHTMVHPALARLPEEAASREITESIGRIEAEIGRRPTSLAFPYGSPLAAGPREARLAEAAGLAASFTTQPGYIRAGGSRHGLPRVSLNGLFQRVRYTETLLSPGLWTLRDKLRGKS